MTMPVAGDKAGSKDSSWALAALGVVLLLQVELVWNRPVNWDEFFHLSEAHAFARGELHELLQVFYARAFFWLASLGIDAVDQIRLARFFMLACELVTCCSIFAISRRFVNATTALLAPLSYVTAGYVLQHGMSFRADPMAAACLMGALWILLRHKLSVTAITAAAILIAIGFTVTIKIVLYAPAFAAIAWLRWHDGSDRRELLRKGAAFIALSLVFSGLFTWLGWLTLPVAPPPAAREAGRSLSSSGKMMFDLGLFPRGPYLIGAIFSAPLLALITIRTAIMLARKSTAPERNLRIAAWLLLATIGCVSFYANSFPYFYAFILPPVAVAGAVGLAAMQQSPGTRILLAAMLVQAAISSFATPREVLPAQKQMLVAVHEVFAEPVAYFDFPGMVPDFRKANLFMTVWGIRKYRAGLEPTMAEVAREQVVPLLIVNQEPLVRNQSDRAGAWELKPEDRILLKDGYVPHWGPLWVAGHTFAPQSAPANFTVYAPGNYTVEGAAATIDGVMFGKGAVMRLGRGSHVLQHSSSQGVTLRWGDHLPRPRQLYTGIPVLKDF